MAPERKVSTQEEHELQEPARPRGCIALTWLSGFLFRKEDVLPCAEATLNGPA